MNTITRYVLREFAKVFVMTLAAMTSLLLILGLVKEALDQGIGGKQILLLIPYVLPNALLFSVPGTTLFSICVVYGRMSSDNEILAIKSQGVHPMHVMAPVLAGSFLLSLATVCLNDVAWSWGFHGIQRVVLESSEELIYGMLRSHKSYNTRDFSIFVKDVQGQRLIKPVITFRNSGEQADTTITAEEAELRCDLEARVLAIICFDGTMTGEGEVSFRFPDTVRREISLDELQDKRDDTHSATHLTLRELSDAIEDHEAAIVRKKQELAVKAAARMLTGDFPDVAGPSCIIENQELDRMKYEENRLRTEPSRRWANGFSCLCFALVGMPIAIRMRTAGFLISFFACFLPILCFYYPLLLLGVEQAKNGTVPPQAAWLGDLLLTTIGIWQMRRVFRY